ncbi:MAG: sugar transferase [Oscillospiraceae bacterium]|nr:sugar transferase [Oscillospiraceae bacterium]
MYRTYVKRILDFFIGALVLFLLWPVMLLMAAAIYIEDPGPVLFRQRRLGLGAREFTMLKFRSMKQNSEHTGSGVYSGKDDPRVLKTGKIFRATSMDELIQAVHLISGKMSLIGPRPPLTYHPWPIEEYTKEQLHMFDVRPGITGWAQVNGRKGVEWNRRIELSCWYADHVSFALDVKIFFLTIFKVLRNEDNLNTEPTMRGK